jgi:nucleoside-diphosphate-sugar epimerase
MKTITVIGAKGMLGFAVAEYLESADIVCSGSPMMIMIS